MLHSSAPKRETQAGGPGLPKDEKLLLLDKSFLPGSAPAVNPDSPRLWSAFRRYARNHRRIARLVAENEALLERLRQIQGMPS
jgi:hypothetical protein